MALYHAMAFHANFRKRSAERNFYSMSPTMALGLDSGVVIYACQLKFTSRDGLGSKPGIEAIRIALIIDVKHFP